MIGWIFLRFVSFEVFLGKTGGKGFVGFGFAATSLWSQDACFCQLLDFASDFGFFDFIVFSSKKAKCGSVPFASWVWV